MYAHCGGARRVLSPTITSWARAQAKTATARSSVLPEATATEDPVGRPRASRAAAPVSTRAAKSAYDTVVPSTSTKAVRSGQRRTARSRTSRTVAGRRG